MSAATATPMQTRRVHVSESFILRLVVSSVAAVALVSAMFFFLRALVGAHGGVTDLKPAMRIEFSRLRRDSDVESRRASKPKLELGAQAPAAPMMAVSSRSTGGAAPISVAPAKMGEVVANVGMKKLMVKAGGSDRDVVPLVRIEPEYPARALQRGIAGWVLLRFTITPIGTVKDAVVIDASPKKVFDDAAVAAVSRWKYNPKIEEGVAVERRGVQILLRFDLAKDSAQ